MTSGMILKSLFETALIIFTLWAVFNEDKFIAIERRIFAAVRRRRLRVINGGSFKNSSYPVHNR